MQPSKEQVSALVDDEIPQVSPALLAALTADEELLGAWSRYHLIGEVLRGGAGPLVVSTLDARVRQALAAEAVVLAPAAGRPKPARQPAPWFWPALPLAAGLAACGLLATYLVASSTQSEGWDARPALASRATLRQPVAPVSATISPPPGAPEQAVAAQRQRRLNSYLVNFNEQREQLALPNIHPYVRSVGYSSVPLP